MTHHADGRPLARLERVLAVGRAFLTVSALAAIYLDPTQPTRLAEITYGVLAAYALYSIAVMGYVHRAARLTPAHGLALHGFDVLWTAALTFVSDGPVSPFFLFFLFVVLAAAYRWGFVGTAATAFVTVGVFLLETVFAAIGPWNEAWFTATQFELNRTILRVAYLLLTGFLLGYLAEQEKRTRAELEAIADITRQPGVHLGLGGSIAAVGRRLRRIFRAETVVFVLQDYETRETSLWRIDAAAAEGPPDRARVQPNANEQAAWLFADPGRSWHAVRDGANTSARARVVEHGVWPLRRTAVEIPAPIVGAVGFRKVAVANLGLPDEWKGRVYLFDPASTRSVEPSMHFLDALVEHVTPALTNVFLLGRMRARVTAAERARVARELHDGAIQSLFGIEMKLEALRRASWPADSDVERELEDIQELVRREVLALRELMQALRPIPLDSSDQLPDVLAQVVERFRRDTALPARFVFTGKSPVFPAATALEVVRIVQEGLVNVRKHSGARNVLVRLVGDDDACTLAIEDDGTGFAFEGHLTGEELDRRRLGPAIIKERARIIGAALTIESIPGAGARIDIRLNTGP